jgi:hypothetical protein
LKFAQRAELGANGEIQKQKFEGASFLETRLCRFFFISQGEVAAQKKWRRKT